MRSPHSQKTPRWRDERGSISLAVVLLFFLFSGLGLSMIFLSQVYLRLNAWRKSSAVLDIASENGIKRGFQDLADGLNACLPVVPISADAVEGIRAEPESGLDFLLRETLGIPFPRTREETWEKMIWKSIAACGLRRIEDSGPYVTIRAGIGIESEGSLDGQAARRSSSLEADLILVAGRIPLAALPLLVDGAAEGETPSDFAVENGISIAAGPGTVVEPKPVLTPGGLIPGDATPMLGRALHVDLLRPQDLTASRLRAFLGLEASDEPVPEGVYLIRNDIGLGGIFVQGDLEEMITAIREDFQIIAFRMEAGEWRLEFSPSRSRTEFLTPAGSESFALVPAGMIIVNGKVLRLGGGEVGPGGDIAAVTDREIPSILGGVALTIIASDEITLTSHLLLQNVRWRDGIPVIRDPQTQLVIYSTGQDVLSGEDRAGGIRVAADAPAEMKVQASLTAAGNGFEILGEGRTVELLGGLQTAGYAGQGNFLRIVPDPRARGGVLPADGPLTAAPIVSILSFQISSWKET